MKRCTMCLFKPVPSIVMQDLDLQQAHYPTVLAALKLAKPFSNLTALGQTRNILMHLVLVLPEYVPLVGPVSLLQCRLPARLWGMANSSGGSTAMSQICTRIRILEDHSNSAGALGETQSMSSSGKMELVKSGRPSLKRVRTWLPLMLTDT